MNADKACFTLLGTAKSLEKAADFSLHISGADIRPLNHVKILGVLLDQTLSWDAHISSIVRRTSAILISLFKIRHHLSSDILKILIQSHVFPHLQYCSSVWGGAPSYRLDRLQKVIHFAARLVSGLRRFDHVTPALAALGWPGVRGLIARRDAVNVFRALRDTAAPDSLRAMFRPRSAVSVRRTQAAAAGAAVLELPRLRLTTTRRLFPYRAAASWNALPRDVTRHESRSALKSALNTHLNK